jgi:hypothetical protein
MLSYSTYPCSQGLLRLGRALSILAHLELLSLTFCGAQDTIPEGELAFFITDQDLESMIDR